MRLRISEDISMQGDDLIFISFNNDYDYEPLSRIQWCTGK